MAEVLGRWWRRRSSGGPEVMAVAVVLVGRVVSVAAAGVLVLAGGRASVFACSSVLAWRGSSR